MNEQLKQIVTWVTTGDTGNSSKAMIGVLTGTVTEDLEGRHPYDPSDFKRCVELLKAVPSLRKDLHLMGEVSPEWKALVDNWDYLEKTLEIEIQLNPSQAPFLYKYMNFLTNPNRAVA